MPPLLLATSLVAVIACFLHSFLLLFFRQFRSPLRHLPGPPSPSFLTGNLEELHDQENNNLIANWVSRYGPNFVYRGFIGGCRLMTTDPVAVAHILGNAYDYPKPDFVRDALASMAAGHNGLLTVEGDDHKRQVCSYSPFDHNFIFTSPVVVQRKILVSWISISSHNVTIPTQFYSSFSSCNVFIPLQQTPAFSASHIKSLTPIFWHKASEVSYITPRSVLILSPS